MTLKSPIEKLLPLALSSVLVLGLGIIFSVWTATSWLEYPRFLATAVLLFVLPGFAVTRWLRIDVSPIERLTLSLVLGIVTTCALYAAAAWLGYPDLVWPWILVCVISSIHARKSILPELQQGVAGVDTSHALLPLAIFAGLLPLYILPFYYGNLASNAQGAMTIGGPPDLLLHLSVAAELTHTFPPQVPFLSDVSLNYHIGMDLVTAVLNRCGGVSIADSVARFCPTLFVVVSILSAFCLAYRFIGSGPAAVAAALLVMLGEDFSFVPGILRNVDLIWASEFFQAPTVIGLYLFNPMAIGHGLLFSSLLCLHRSVESPRPGWIAAAALCSAALVQTKIFAFMHLAIALCIVETIQLVIFRRAMFLKQGIGILLASLPLLLPTLLMTENVKPVDWVWSSGLDTYVDHASRTTQWPVLFAYPFVGLIAYLIFTYGFRILGIVEWFKSFRLAQSRPFPFLLAVFVALGPLLSLTSYISPRDDSNYNNAIWFMVQSKYVATLFAIVALAGLWKKIGPAGRPVLVAAIAAISLASTVQYLIFMTRGSMNNLPAAVTEITRFLNSESRPGQVAISRIEAPTLALTKLRVPSYNVYSVSFASRELLDARARDMQAFWQSWDRGTVRTDLLLKYHADWIVAIRANGVNPHLDSSSQIAGEKLGIELVFTNERFQVYRVSVARR